MNAYVFPGQGAQFEGMGKNLFEEHQTAKEYFLKANDILGFRITDVMFEGSAEDLKQTKVTQPAVFLHSIIQVMSAKERFKPDVVAGHSLGELTALVANGVLSFEDGLRLVSRRALAMQSACEATKGTMAAILGLENDLVENICKETEGVVIAANYNCPGQLVISGELAAVEAAAAKCSEAGARRAIMLPVGGAFHSPLMEPAKAALQIAIQETTFNKSVIPVYQNVTAQASTDPELIKENLIAQMTSPVKWTQTMLQMNEDGVKKYIEVGAKVLSGFVKKIDRSIPTEKFEWNNEEG